LGRQQGVSDRGTNTVRQDTTSVSPIVLKASAQSPI
jgi:hypothetical protein